MSERLKPGEIEPAKRISRKLEDAWRIFTHPGKYKQEEVNHAHEYLSELKGKLKTLMEVDMEGGKTGLEIYDNIFMGLYHHNVRIRPADPVEKSVHHN